MAGLTGAALSLGRYQRVASTLTPRGQAAPLTRRITGGRALALGDGLWGLALVLPHRSWLLSDEPEAIPASAFLNRNVRGILSGLATLGMPAYYFGRDFITVDGGQAAYLSFEITAEGTALLECILPGASHWWLPEGLSAQLQSAPSRGQPAPIQPEKLRDISSDTLLRALGRGFAERYGVTTADATEAITPRPLPSPAEETLFPGSPFPVPIGFAEVGVRLEGGRLAETSLRGDFLADSAGIALAETGLCGAPFDADEIARRTMGVFHRDAHAMLGADPESFAPAIVSAAQRAQSLEALAGKYRALIDLRLIRDEAMAAGASGFSEEERPQRREAMRSVAARFPGALRELDDSTIDQLRDRLAQLAAALRSGAVQPWMETAACFHELLREALLLRRRSGVAAGAWAGQEELVRRPPGGRLLGLVWSQVEQRLGLATGEASALVYPNRKSC